ncbi:S-layer homology domain-containing protein [Leptolyngbya sp. KIOST-1]|uniref:S-layer homology domain-containing protein n=1 Tax=Leptolyngbya sp. KIOST-1 TaxID=1229172 RepID=UPI0021F19838|nr:S-layer homology domain-containing protein [Leptolyngbya sp. KIOST-1]
MKRWMQVGSAVTVGTVAATAIAPAWANPGPADPAIAIPAAQAQAAPPQRVLPFTDVSPDHWAYEALLNLAGTYGCISGYPDGTFRGENAVTRFEFAAGMDSCLSVVAGMAAQQAEARDREVQSLIQSMEQSLSELRQLESDLPELP